MGQDAPTGHPAVGLAARIIGALAAAMWLLPLVGGLFTDDRTEDGSLAESIGVVVLAGVNIVGVVVAFRRPRIGGRLLLLSGVLFSLFAIATAGRNEAFAAAVSGGPFIVSGALFSVASRDDGDS